MVFRSAARKLRGFGGSFLEVDPGFQRDPETVGDPVGIGEVGDDLHEIEDVPIAEALKAKTLDIALGDICWSDGQLLGILEHRHSSIAQPGGSEVRLERRGQIVIFEEPAQTAPMMGHSIVAVVQLRHDNRHHLALDLAERLGGFHHLGVQLLVSGEPFGVQ